MEGTPTETAQGPTAGDTAANDLQTPNIEGDSEEDSLVNQQLAEEQFNDNFIEE